MNLNQVDGLVIAAGCAAAGLVVGASTGYIIGHDDGVKETTQEMLDVVHMLESKDNALSDTTKSALDRIKTKANDRLSSNSFNFKDIVRALGVQTKKALAEIPTS